MDKSIKIILVIVGILVLVNLGFNLFGVNSNIKDSLQRIHASQEKLDSAMEAIARSKAQLDSLQVHFSKFNSYVRDIQGRVEIMDLERRANDQRFRMKKDSINLRLKNLYKDIQTTGDDLPPVEEFDSIKN
jgi:hypothetical protein